MRFHGSFLELLNSRTKVKIIKFLLNNEVSMSEREIALILKISHMYVNRFMRELYDINFVNYVTVGRAHLWKVNKKSYAFKVLSKLVDGFLGTQDSIEDLKETILKNLPKKLIKKVVLFGSVAKGSELVNSDIDIFILLENSQDNKKLEAYIEKLSDKCFEIYGNRLAPYILTDREVKQIKNLKILSEIAEGIQLFPKIRG